MSERGAGPRDEGALAGSDAERQRRLARRRLVRELHPDRGGDPAVYLAALAEFDARHGAPQGASEGASEGASDPGDGEVVLVRSRRWGWPARLRRRLRDHRRRNWARL